MGFVKPIREKGIIISKEYRVAKEARTDMDGKSWPAREEEYIVEVMSCDEDDFSKDTGILNGTLAKYPVAKEIYDKAKFGMWANVKYTASQYKDRLSIRPETFNLIEKQ